MKELCLNILRDVPLLLKSGDQRVRPSKNKKEELVTVGVTNNLQKWHWMPVFSTTKSVEQEKRGNTTKLLIRKSMIQNWSYEIDDARWCTMIPYRDDPIPRWYHTAEAVTPVDTQWYVTSISRAIYRDLVVKSLLWWFTILMAAKEPVLFFGNPENDGTDGSTWCVTIIE